MPAPAAGRSPRRRSPPPTRPASRLSRPPAFRRADRVRDDRQRPVDPGVVEPRPGRDGIPARSRHRHRDWPISSTAMSATSIGCRRWCRRHLLRPGAGGERNGVSGPRHEASIVVTAPPRAPRRRPPSRLHGADRRSPRGDGVDGVARRDQLPARGRLGAGTRQPCGGRRRQRDHLRRHGPGRHLLHAPAGAERLRREPTRRWRCRSRWAARPRRSCPASLPVNQGGSGVPFTWLPPLGATSYRMRVGTAPGVTNVADLDVGAVDVAGGAASPASHRAPTTCGSLR